MNSAPSSAHANISQRIGGGASAVPISTGTTAADKVFGLEARSQGVILVLSSRRHASMEIDFEFRISNEELKIRRRRSRLRFFIRNSSFEIRNSIPRRA